MTFRNFVELYSTISESLDSPVKIDKIQKEGNLTFFYFNINNKEFRAVIELAEDGEAGLVFEQKINGRFIYEGIQDNLSTKESFSLFSTLKSLIQYLPSQNSIYTDSKKKLRLYLKILTAIPEIRYVRYTENTVPYIIEFGYTEKIPAKDSKFKSKIWK